MTPKNPCRTTLTAAAISLAVAFGATAQTGAAGTPNSAKAASASTNKAANADSAFARKAALGGLAEVELGNLAQQKASSAQVKEFAARMVQDHSKANDELKQIAAAKGIDLPMSLDKAHKNDLDRLGRLSGAEFDRAYMSHMVDDHKKDVAEFKKQASGGKDTELKAFAAKSLPVLEDHLKLAQQTHAAVKGGKAGPEAKKGAAK